MDGTDPPSRRGFLRLAGGAIVAGPLLAGTADVVRADPYNGWFDDVDNYEGTFDYRGQDAVRVSVGAGNGLLYDPPAILVDQGTTVTWEWTGEGGQHDVNGTGGPAPLESDLIDTQGHEYQFTFESDHEGITQYVCTPHEAVGMKGVVVVGDVILPDDEVISIDDEPAPADPPAEDAEGPAVFGPWDPLDQLAVALGLALGGFLLVIPAFFGYRSGRSE